ncbi:very short patch repair endonuclease [Rhodohalobacter sulfatireducens]|uniref:Very short patch repair endonuclease n=1 Tax=Rhodohalobacter sulfatireducens TaxID=2911366 RepID=A0ABS9KIT0_9BACT|nr:DNA mismatch endonuclease Vsr [Rhodohalobacter sulfatireducens]MCG2590765.1 DNA mismatch endonuclease Vsr [Rhodohalobacter sulfatireducens]
MADVHEPETRSYNMSKISGKDTKPEMIVRKFLHTNGFRYGLHRKDLPGKPDLVMPKYNTVIFVHGCFWHAHEDCKYFKIPQTRTEWWKEKLYGNKERDEKHIQELEDLGWNVIVVWECEMKPDKKTKTLAGLANNLQNNLK